MPDIIQLKRGPSSNIEKTFFKQGEPAFIYDLKQFCIGTAENKPPIVFLNQEQVKDLIMQCELRLSESVTNANFNIEELSQAIKEEQLELDEHAKEIGIIKQTIDTNHQFTVSELNKKAEKGKIIASDLSTAYDEDKIGLANLRQEVLTYIVLNGTSGPNERPLIPAGSITIDLLSKELAEIVSNDYGSY